MIELRLSLGPAAEPAEARLAEWDAADAVARLWDRDTTLWAADPPPPEMADRLGWLDLPETAMELLPELAALRAEIPFWMTDLVLLGMGGSSLAPEVLARSLGGDGLPLTVMDSTHPGAVRALEWVNPANTIFLVSSKSGTTLETTALFRHFWSRVQEVVDEPGAHFVAITDPDSPLAALGRERGFRRVFEAAPDVGGRFSALSHFGLVPAALMGLDLPPLLESARLAADACREEVPHNPGFRLGAALSELTLAGRDKWTFVSAGPWTAFPDWAEQLIAESTGKDGVGIVPVAHEPWLDPEAYGEDRVFVGLVPTADAAREAAQWGEEDVSRDRLEVLEAAGHPVVRLELEGPHQMGALFFIWEVAVAMAGSALGVHPFDQPDVQLAKELAQRAMAGEDVSGGAEAHDEIDLDWGTPAYGHAATRAPAEPDVSAMRGRVRDLLEAVRPGDYVGIHAYLAGDSEDEPETFDDLRRAITEVTGAATTLGYGPRFLHSTGQLHKGGPDNGVFVQIVDDAATHVHVPEGEFTFHQLIRAQARGDLGALRERARRTLRVRVAAGGDGLDRLLRLVHEMSEES